MSRPLADRLRPSNIDEVFGQKHLLGPNKPLRRIIESGQITNLIFYGPSGVGKTTIANIIAKKCNKKLYRLNATTASVSDIKEIISGISAIDAPNGILLYLDEIQYFNKKQQQILLEYIESGDITLIASTTENPYFYVYNAVLSRSTVFEFKMLEPADIVPALERAIGILSEERSVQIQAEQRILLNICSGAGGDVRKALNILEMCILSVPEVDGKVTINDEIVSELTVGKSMRYDKNGDDHYDIISAYQKSMRGSDADAALHYLARLLEAGDLPSACRRLLVCACEDVGLAHPQIIPIVKAAVDTALMVGLPEARIPLADAVVLVCISPKSNSVYNAINAAVNDVQTSAPADIPRALKNKHFDGEDATVKGQFYKYPHDYKNHYVYQQYLPDSFKNKTYYQFGDNKNEQRYKEYWDQIKPQNK